MCDCCCVGEVVPYIFFRSILESSGRQYKILASLYFSIKKDLRSHFLNIIMTVGYEFFLESLLKIIMMMCSL